VFTDEDLNSIPATEERPVGSKLTGFEIHEEEVLKHLVALNPYRSCGPDGFHSRLLKELATVLLGHFFSSEKTLNEGTLPADWKEAQVTPFSKKSERNYLPDVESSVCSMYADGTKIFNTVIDASNKVRSLDDLDRLVNWADMRRQLRFDADKCKVLHLGMNNEQQDYSMEDMVATRG
jgi:hypothetical protein